jgi:hypothetical protein
VVGVKVLLTASYADDGRSEQAAYARALEVRSLIPHPSSLPYYLMIPAVLIYPPGPGLRRRS